MTSARDRRVTLALKWHYLDDLDVEDIQQRFIDEGYGEYAKSTIRNYLNEEPKDAVLEQIEEEQATVRLQIADREEQLYQRAREAEFDATDDDSIRRVVPATATVSTERETSMQVPDWEILDPGHEDRPEWATDRDVIICFTGGHRRVMPGEPYPVQQVDGSPKYTTEFAGLERDVPDEQARSSLRREQSQHLQAKGDVVGVYKDRVELEGSLETETTVGVDEETKSLARELLATRYDQERTDGDE